MTVTGFMRPWSSPTVEEEMAVHCGIVRRDPAKLLTISRVLAWADAYNATHGRWPTQRSGLIVPGVTWATVNQALRLGYRGLPGGSSLASLLASERGMRTRRMPLELSEDHIIGWADGFFAKYGRWPTQRSGPIDDGVGLTWSMVEQALLHGRHGLAGGSSLATLLQSERGVGKPRRRRQLTIAHILLWADAYRAGGGKWPTKRSGLVDGTTDVTWAMIDRALRRGRHGLVGNSSLGELLEKERGARRRTRTVLTLRQRQVIRSIWDEIDLMKRPSRRTRAK